MFKAIKEAYTNYSGKKTEDVFSKLQPYAVVFIFFAVLALGFFLMKRVKTILLLKLKKEIEQ